MPDALLPPTRTTAILRGICGRCPNCGKGKLFARFLKVAETCNACGEELNHHRADDLPAYLTILILGHILVPLIVWTEVTYHPAYWIQAALWIPTTLIVSLALLQPCKGAVVATEWHLGLRGYSPAKERRDALLVANAARNNEPPVL